MLLSDRQISKSTHLLLVVSVLLLTMEMVVADSFLSSVPQSGLLALEGETHAANAGHSISDGHSIEVEAKNIDNQASDCHTSNGLQEDCCVACMVYFYPEESTPLSSMITGYFFAETSIPIVSLSLPREIRPPKS